MTRKKNGKSLEWMIAVLEQSFTTTESIVRRNFIIVDQHGVGRELDIYVETKVNGKVFKYAFECKDYKSGIKVGQIVDFHSKIEAKGMKGFFVTTSHFQKGAREKAEALSIDLLKLTKRRLDKNGNLSLIMAEKHFKMKSFNIYMDKTGNEELLKSHPIEKCETCSTKMVALLTDSVKPLVQEQLGAGIDVMYPEFKNLARLKYTVGEENAKEFDLMLKFTESSFRHLGVEFSFEWVRIEMKGWHELMKKEPVNTSFFEYLQNKTDDLLGTFTLNEFVIEGGNLIVGIARPKDGKEKMAVTDSFSKMPDSTELVCVGKLDAALIKNILQNEKRKKDNAE